jgi:hypothetical protein
MSAWTRCAVFLLLVAWNPSAKAATQRALRCQDGGVTVRREHRDQILAAVRRVSRFPVVRIEASDPSEHAGPGVLVAVTLRRGTCTCGEGDEFWVQEVGGRWRVLKKSGGYGCMIAS